MKDLYSILGVPQEASQKEIKSAFRKRAKVRHPDTGGGDEEAMRAVLEAYRVLSDPQSRREYDRGRLRIVPHGEGSAFDYRVWLKERLDEPEYIAKLVFYDLLHDLEDEALSLYERIRDTDDGRLERFFERPEAMDAEFCIAEEYAARGRFVDAYRVMRRLITMEQRSPGFGYFYDVVLSRFRRLILEDLPKVLEPEALLDTLAEAVELRSSAENDAQFLRRRAEILLRLGRATEARTALARASALAPRLPGLKTLAMKMANTLAKSAQS
ncbi:MAG: DnaJ domain-containing protein [Spirochaetes bacterium]|nr:DnaJ domain-containing protein [Spirochaetota bacterium]MBU1079291.1 DnaJ domain-containing protein [Spirochaetota bacterium]